jgi:hypothetical protein
MAKTSDFGGGLQRKPSPDQEPGGGEDDADCVFDVKAVLPRVSFEPVAPSGLQAGRVELRPRTVHIAPCGHKGAHESE